MIRQTFRHLDREWEASIPDADEDPRPVRFRSERDDDPKRYEALVDVEDLQQDAEAETALALRRGLESALILDVLTGHEAGLTVREVAEMTGMPVEGAKDRLEVLDEVQPVLDESGPRRYRTLEE